MATVDPAESALAVDLDGAPVPTIDGGREAEASDPPPWWHSPWRLAVLALALLFLGGAAGYAWTARGESAPGSSSVDVGFLQDMRLHHDQAVAMGFLMLGKEPAAQDRFTRLLAGEIVASQQFEAGVMAQMLRGWGRPEANESGQVMGWMGMPLPAERMPGMAADADLERLRGATGTEADRLFLELMIAHHEGALHMAEDASARAGEAEVRTLAAAIRDAQAFEIGELQRARAALG